jgi:hypothetical protein
MGRHLRESGFRKAASVEAGRVADGASELYAQSREALEEAYHRAREVLGDAAGVGRRALRDTRGMASRVDGNWVAIAAGMAAIGFAIGWYCRDRDRRD